MAYNWRKIGREAASIAAILGVTSLLTEGIFELMLRNPSYVPTSILPAIAEYYYAEDQRFIQYLPDCAKYDAALTYTLRPGSCEFFGREFDTTVTVNTLGVRDDQESLKAAEIFVLGDSFAMGWGVGDDETFASLIEKETGIKVLNLAVSSYGTVREFDIAARADASRLRTVVVQYSHNDFEENKTYLENGNHLPIRTESAYEEIRHRHLQETEYFVGKHVWWLVRRLAGSLVTIAHAQEQSDEARFFFDVLFKKLAELSQRAKLAPGSILVIVQGVPWPVSASNDFIADLRTRPAAIALILEIGRPDRPGSYYRLDGHFTAIGHREIADQIKSIVRDKCYLADETGSLKEEQQGKECRFFVDEL